MKIKKRYYVFVIILGLLVYMFYQNTFLKVTRYSIDDEEIPKNFEGYKIAQVSDYHNVSNFILNNKIVKSLEEEEPDIVVITGDFIDSYITRESVSLDLIKKISGIAPIYYVPGNHEARIEEYDDFKKELEKLDVNVLEDEMTLLEKDGEYIELIGIRDPLFTSEKENINTLKSLVYDNENYKILLAHRPELIDDYEDASVNLVFSGHVHGGQIRLPFVGGVLSSDQGLFPKYDKGIFKEKDTFMVLSAGIGNSIIPFRINNRPELVIVEL